VAAAVGLVDATYGALGVIGDGDHLVEFIPVGLSQDEIGRIHGNCDGPLTGSP